MLNDQQLKDINENGFTVFEGGFDESTLVDLKTKFESEKENIKNYSGWAYMGIFRHSEEFRDFISESGALNVAKQLHQSDKVDLYWDSVVIKSAGNQRQFCWHQDEGYTATDPTEYFTFWIPLQDVDDQNGGLWVIPGSHKKGLVKHSPVKVSETRFPGLEIEEVDNSLAQVVALKVGQVLVFSSYLYHRSGANNTENDRLAMAFAVHKSGFKEINVPENLDPVEGLPL